MDINKRQHINKSINETKYYFIKPNVKAIESFYKSVIDWKGLKKVVPPKSKQNTNLLSPK